MVDRRLRDALRARRVSELDGLVFAAAGSTDVRSNAIVTRRARQWATHHRLPCVTAFGAGVRTDSGRGRPYAAEPGSPPRRRRQLVPGAHARSSSARSPAALAAGAVAVSEPLGAGPELAEVVLSRYVVAAMELVDLESDDAAETEDAPVRHLSVVSA